ncbi:MAG: flagellar basal body P-ring protein FlgI [Planctomycetota bacterium]
MPRAVDIGRRVMMGCAATALVGLASSCTTTRERAPRATEVDVVTRDIAQILTDTIGAQAQLSGMNPQLVSGYGLVVGLNGTGSGDVPLSIRIMLEEEMSKLGVGKAGGPLENVAPSRMIDDLNTSVVMVQAVIPPAAPEGTRFDCSVATLPGSSTTSLEGGRLYTTDLRRGLPVPGGPDTAVVARASGTLFINPFNDPGADTGAEEAGVVRTRGVILDGGSVLNEFTPVLVLDNPSHSRARSITAAINARFPQRTNRLPVGRGINDETIEINVPLEYRGDVEDFFQILLHTRVDRTFPEQWARRYTEALKEQPQLAEPLSWCLQAVGNVSLPFIRPMYVYPEVVPRFAALQAGARMGDPTTRAHLEDLVLNGPPAVRTDAIGLLSNLGPDPRINQFLLDMLSSPDLDIRIAAYEGLDRRADPRIQTYYAELDRKFRVDLVPSAEPMVYFTQSGTPKIVLFDDLTVNQPSFVSGWNGRLMLSSDASSGRVRMFYRDHRGNESQVNELSPRVVEMLRYFAHETTPEEPAPGLDMTYSETIGALHEIVQGGAIDAVFVPETDRLQLEILRMADRGEFEIRPELSEEGALDEAPVAVLATGRSGDGADEDDPEREARRRKYMVPLKEPPPPPPPSDEPDG